MRPGLRWLLFITVPLCLVVLGSVFAPFILPPRLTADLASFWREELSERVSGVLILSLVYLVMVIVVLCSMDSGPQRNPKGELERVIHLKHRGTLLLRSSQIRESAARTSRYAGTADQFRQLGLAQLPAVPDATKSPEDVMDRLVRLKRRGAWTPSRPA